MASKFVISPEPFVQKCRSLAKSRDIHVEVEEGLSRLAWTDFSHDGLTKKVEYIDRIEAAVLGISYDLLLDAVSDGDGAIESSGRYLVIEEIIRRLKKAGLRK
ncbi:MAG: hypothetical protein LUQ38_10130 [Methanotrichaceae archaeon]|nr:hypothetical protein [Methanotrichaceae archaeon]